MYPRIIDRLVNVPLLITEDKLDVITSQVSVHLITNNLSAIDNSESSNVNTTVTTKNSFGVIEVRNSLVAKNGGGSSGSTSYEFIRSATNDFVAANINTIIFDVSSNGGEAAGCFPLTDFIYELNKQGIRTIGFTDTYACSGGYAILSACSEVYATDLAYVGSIGAVMSVIDVTKMDEKMGVKYDILRSKELKGGYSPHETITPALKKDMIEGLKVVDTKFDLSVLKYRKGKVSQETLTNLSGRSITAQEGLQFGLVDQIVSGIDEVFTLLTNSSSNNVSLTSNKGVNMTTNAGNPNPSIESQYIASQTELSQLKESLNTKIAAAVSEERARCAAILKAGTTYKVDSAMVVKAIEKNYSMEMVEDSFSFIAEQLDNKTSIHTTGNSTKTDLTNLPKGEEKPKSYLDALVSAIPNMGDK